MIHFLRVKPGFNQMCYGKSSSPGERKDATQHRYFFLSHPPSWFSLKSPQSLER